MSDTPPTRPRAWCTVGRQALRSVKKRCSVNVALQFRSISWRVHRQVTCVLRILKRLCTPVWNAQWAISKPPTCRQSLFCLELNRLTWHVSIYTSCKCCLSVQQTKVVLLAGLLVALDEETSTEVLLGPHTKVSYIVRTRERCLCACVNNARCCVA